MVTLLIDLSYISLVLLLIVIILCFHEANLTVAQAILNLQFCLNILSGGHGMHPMPAVVGAVTFTGSGAT